MYFWFCLSIFALEINFLVCQTENHVTYNQIIQAKNPLQTHLSSRLWNLLASCQRKFKLDQFYQRHDSVCSILLKKKGKKIKPTDRVTALCTSLLIQSSGSNEIFQDRLTLKGQRDTPVDLSMYFVLHV